MEETSKDRELIQLRALAAIRGEQLRFPAEDVIFDEYKRFSFKEETDKYYLLNDFFKISPIIKDEDSTDDLVAAMINSKLDEEEILKLFK